MNLYQNCFKKFLPIFLSYTDVLNKTNVPGHFCQEYYTIDIPDINIQTYFRMVLNNMGRIVSNFIRIWHLAWRLGCFFFHFCDVTSVDERGNSDFLLVKGVDPTTLFLIALANI